MKRNQKVEDYIESRLDELQERFRKLYKDTDRAAQSMLIRELRHIKTMITIEEEHKKN